jgi:hypothetical protein
MNRRPLTSTGTIRSTAAHSISRQVAGRLNRSSHLRGRHAIKDEADIAQSVLLHT